MTRSTDQPGQTRPRSTVNRVTGQPERVNGSTDPVNGLMGQPGQRLIGSDPTWSTVNRVTGQPEPVNGSTRSTVNRVNRVKPDPVNTAKPYTRAATRRPFWWRVRAREREFLGNFGTYRFVSKFPTMWYIDLPCLKLLKT